MGISDFLFGNFWKMIYKDTGEYVRFLTSGDCSREELEICLIAQNIIDISGINEW